MSYLRKLEKRSRNHPTVPLKLKRSSQTIRPQNASTSIKYSLHPALKLAGKSKLLLSPEIQTKLNLEKRVTSVNTQCFSSDHGFYSK